MQFNHAKLKALESRVETLRDFDNALDRRFYADRSAVEAAERELERQREGRRHLGPGVPGVHVRKVREERERLEQTVQERGRVSESLKRGQALIQRCHEYMLDVHGVDLEVYPNQPGDADLSLTADEVAELKRTVGIPASARNEYVFGIESRQEEL